MDYPGRFIQRGSKGDAVLTIQGRLGVEQTGLFGPTTEECVTAFQRGRGLEADGIVGPDTWKALFKPEPAVDLGEAALKEARARVGVSERPLGSNAGPEVNQYLQRVGLEPGRFWCLAFVYYCVDEACKKLGRSNPLPRTASCSQIYQWARDHGRLAARPAPGDVFLCIGGETGHYHSGLVDGPVKSARFPTVEGNSNTDGSANGVGVVRRPRGRRLPSCHYVRL
jgi:hypothetical protein